MPILRGHRRNAYIATLILAYKCAFGNREKTWIAVHIHSMTRYQSFGQMRDATAAQIY